MNSGLALFLLLGHAFPAAGPSDIDGPLFGQTANYNQYVDNVIGPVYSAEISFQALGLDPKDEEKITPLQTSPSWTGKVVLGKRDGRSLITKNFVLVRFPSLEAAQAAFPAGTYLVETDLGQTEVNYPPLSLPRPAILTGTSIHDLKKRKFNEPIRLTFSFDQKFYEEAEQAQINPKPKSPGDPFEKFNARYLLMIQEANGHKIVFSTKLSGTDTALTLPPNTLKDRVEYQIWLVEWYNEDHGFRTTRGLSVTTLVDTAPFDFRSVAIVLGLLPLVATVLWREVVQKNKHCEAIAR